MIECFNATFVPQITKLQDRENNNWDEFLLPIIFAYNTVVHATTDYSQFQLQFGHEPCLSIDEPSTPFLFNKPQDYYEQMKKNLSIIQRQARDYIINREQQYKNNYDKQRQDPHYEINDLLLLRIFSRSMSDKFVPFHLRDTHNPPPYLDHSQQQSRIHAGKKAKINHQRQQKYPPFIVSSSISEIKHVNKYTTIETMAILLDHIKDCEAFTIDAESEKFNYELALVHVQTNTSSNTINCYVNRIGTFTIS
ncbi:unnamed protein product [Rotaria sordida]|uniref:Uncharacterized protein n=1 Tax=Rotaria sordida TaxID=392033 RepID=A0A819FHI9_9BILA|nr:unnamed protein product [Rotaria sordida]CAF3866539.1 unnamed protein product [Rotaria sordida]CAF4089714.1 unnamed protein product [Rotaria sordida]